MPTTNLAPNKFQERLSGASRIEENLLAAVVLPRAPLGSLQRFHRHSSLFGGEGGWLSPPQETHPALGPLSTLWPSGFGPFCLAPDPSSQNRSCGPFQHDGLDPPMGRGRQIASPKCSWLRNIKIQYDKG